ncbi:DUF2070 family protein [[Eubacterium] cellulosolvens]
MNEDSYLKIKGTTPYYNLIRKISFPSRLIIIVLLFCINIVGGVISFFLVTASMIGAFNGLLFGLVGVTIPSLIADLIISTVFLKDDRLFYLRRCFSLSLFSCTIWAGSMILGGLISLIYSPFKFPSDSFFLGLFFVLPLRFITVNALSSSPLVHRFMASILQPLFTLVTSTFILSFRVFPGLLGFLTGTMIGYFYSSWLIGYIEHKGKEKIRASPLQLFKGFLFVLLDKNKNIFENQLEQLSIEEELKITTIGFRGDKDKNLKCLIVVSNFHPGPFLNVGSSMLPYSIQKIFEREYNVFTVVPHGISGHEMNLVSQEQDDRVINEIRKLMNFKRFKSEASQFALSRYGNASSSCQIFGDCPLITLTLAPQDMEDIPLHAGSRLWDYVKKDFKIMALVDAHNSIKQVTVLKEGDINNLIAAAKVSIKKAQQMSKNRFRIGTAKIDLSEYSPRDGVGSGGGQTLLFQVGDQTTVYLIFDANNMYRGVREKIRSHLEKLGITESEVMTTDTHSVNGLVPAHLGYHPFGEAIDMQSLMEKVEKSVNEARKKLEVCEVASNSTCMKVRILGLRLFTELTDFLYKTIRIVTFSMFPLLIGTVLIFLTYLSKIL